MRLKSLILTHIWVSGVVSWSSRSLIPNKIVCSLYWQVRIEVVDTRHWWIITLVSHRLFMKSTYGIILEEFLCHLVLRWCCQWRILIIDLLLGLILIIVVIHVWLRTAIIMLLVLLLLLSLIQVLSVILSLRLRSVGWWCVVVPCPWWHDLLKLSLWLFIWHLLNNWCMRQLILILRLLLLLLHHNGVVDCH